MQRIFFTSDQHFGHKQIIDFEDRPFENVQNMNDSMIMRWNGVVKNDDMVYHVGDFSFMNKEETTNIFKRLNGRKRLILGNHDRARSKSWWKDVGFEEVYEFPIIYKEFYIVSHEPIYLNKHMPYVNLHGHIHGQLYEGMQHINLCVEHWDYTPILFSDIEELVKKNLEETLIK